jgi:hypothetical protein
MTGANYSEESILESISTDIHNELINAMLEKPFDPADPDELLNRMTAVTTDPKWSYLLDGVHRILGEDFVSDLSQRNAAPELVTFALRQCVCWDGSIQRNCSLCPPRP